jgi:hypothetical protein
MGNVYLLLPFCALFFVALFYLYKRCRGGVHERLFSEYEVNQALRALSVSLLLARDHKSLSVNENAEGVSASRLDILSGTNSGEGGARLEGLVQRLVAELTEYTEVVNNRENKGSALHDELVAAASATDSTTTISSNPLLFLESGGQVRDLSCSKNTGVDNQMLASLH